MKKVIDGKVYNTDTATKVAEWDNGRPYNDFNNVTETLYITKKGNWFLHGEGGANSHYRKSNGNSSWGSSDIIDKSEYEAYQWLEEHNKLEAIEKYFPEEIEEA